MFEAGVRLLPAERDDVVEHCSGARDFLSRDTMGRSLVRGALNDKLFGGAEGAEPHDELREELLERWPCSAVGTDVVLGCACREVFVRR